MFVFVFVFIEQCGERCGFSSAEQVPLPRPRSPLLSGSNLIAQPAGAVALPVLKERRKKEKKEQIN